MTLDVVRAHPIPGRRVLHFESMYEYGSRVDFWPVHRLFTERALPLTVFAVGQALERNPEAAAEGALYDSDSFADELPYWVAASTPTTSSSRSPTAGPAATTSPPIWSTRSSSSTRRARRRRG